MDHLKEENGKAYGWKMLLNAKFHESWDLMIIFSRNKKLHKTEKWISLLDVMLKNIKVISKQFIKSDSSWSAISWLHNPNPWKSFLYIYEDIFFGLKCRKEYFINFLIQFMKNKSISSKGEGDMSPFSFFQHIFFYFIVSKLISKQILTVNGVL